MNNDFKEKIPFILEELENDPLMFANTLLGAVIDDDDNTAKLISGLLFLHRHGASLEAILSGGVPFQGYKASVVRSSWHRIAADTLYAVDVLVEEFIEDRGVGATEEIIKRADIAYQQAMG